MTPRGEAPDWRALTLLPGNPSMTPPPGWDAAGGEPDYRPVPDTVLRCGCYMRRCDLQPVQCAFDLVEEIWSRSEKMW
jgi:hypothetical protein